MQVVLHKLKAQHSLFVLAGINCDYHGAISNEESRAETEKEVGSPGLYSSRLSPEQHYLLAKIFALNKMFMLSNQIKAALKSAIILMSPFDSTKEKHLQLSCINRELS